MKYFGHTGKFLPMSVAGFDASRSDRNSASPAAVLSCSAINAPVRGSILGVPLCLDRRDLGVGYLGKSPQQLLASLMGVARLSRPLIPSLWTPAHHRFISSTRPSPPSSRPRAEARGRPRAARTLPTPGRAHLSPTESSAPSPSSPAAPPRFPARHPPDDACAASSAGA